MSMYDIRQESDTKQRKMAKCSNRLLKMMMKTAMKTTQAHSILPRRYAKMPKYYQNMENLIANIF